MSTGKLQGFGGVVQASVPFKKRAKLNTAGLSLSSTESARWWW